jgi:hypothetical protein
VGVRVEAGIGVLVGVGGIASSLNTMGRYRTYSVCASGEAAVRSPMNAVASKKNPKIGRAKIRRILSCCYLTMTYGLVQHYLLRFREKQVKPMFK